MTSIRRRLLFGLTGLFIVGWLIVVVATYIESRKEIEELFDEQLSRAAKVRVILWEVANTFDDIDDVKHYEQEVARKSQHEEGVVFQVYRGGQLIFHTPDTPSFLITSTPGYSNQILNNQKWRLFTDVSPQDSLIVQAGEPYVNRDKLLYKFTRNSLYPLLLAIPLLAAMIWLGVGRGLRPLKRVSDQVAQRSPSHLNPLETKEAPLEIKIFVDELNTLLGRLREAFDKERQFTANAAHEIRTPLASLKTHAQVALRATEKISREEGLQQIILGVDRINHLVEQLLTLARLDYETQERKFMRINLVSLVRDVLAEIAPMALNKGLDLSLEEHSHGEVIGNSTWLAILVRNLVDNAISYTLPGGMVEVEVAEGKGGVTLLVADTGPGISPDEYAHVFERFYRGSMTESMGCGLGLSIVRRIVELHSARITLVEPPSGKGLQVRVYFPSTFVQQLASDHREQDS
ncbi:MAG: ATP-binding protein [Sulfuricaulis sp.]